jgi:hypothetical protein
LIGKFLGVHDYTSNNLGSLFMPSLAKKNKAKKAKHEEKTGKK